MRHETPPVDCLICLILYCEIPVLSVRHAHLQLSFNTTENSPKAEFGTRPGCKKVKSRFPTDLFFWYN